MGISPLNNLALGSLQSLFGSALQSAGITNSNKTASTAGIQQPDNSQLSPFAQLMNTLQQLQQSNPTQYQQVTQQIATNLQSAATTAQSDGNTGLANQLNQLSTDFSNASQNGQLPNVQDLAQAVGGHHHGGHHHHGGGASSSDSDSTSTTNSVSQLLSAFQTNGTQNSSLNPFSIISSTLQNAGITTSTSL